VIVKENLSPTRIVQYTARPLAWAAMWAIAAPALYELTDDERLVLPFAPVATLGAALAIFIAFRNNTSFGRWNEARAAWQSVLVACRVLARQLLAATENAVASGSAERTAANSFARETVLRLSAFAYLLAGRVRAPVDWARTRQLVDAEEAAVLERADNAPNVLLARQSARIKDGIRAGVLGQFDPISLEPQLAALSAAQGTIERLKWTPTPRQYGYFTRRFVELFALVVPFGLLSLFPTAIWWTTPLALVLSGTFVVMAVTGAANDEPFAGRVTDVPIATIAAEIEHDLRELLGDATPPAIPQPVDGYLW
jgi:putative membrane protein